MDATPGPTRAMTADERAAFEALLHDVPDAAGMRRRTTAVATIAWVVFSALAIGVALAIVTGLRAASVHDIDWRSPAGAAGAALIAAAVAAGLWPSLRRRHRTWREAATAQRADLDAGRVRDEHHRFIEVAAFREPEHGGLMYVLRSPDDRAYLMYDTASVAFDEAKVPTEPLLRPAPRLHLVRAPTSGLAIVRRFEGEPFASVVPAEFGGDIEALPGDDGWLPWRWTEALRRLTGDGPVSGSLTRRVGRR